MVSTAVKDPKNINNKPIYVIVLALVTEERGMLQDPQVSHSNLIAFEHKIVFVFLQAKKEFNRKRLFIVLANTTISRF